MVGPDGNEFAFNGEYREIDAPERLVNTEIYEAFPDSPSLVTVTLDERDGVTHFRSLVRHQSHEARDAHVTSGMESGADLSLDLLE